MIKIKLIKSKSKGKEMLRLIEERPREAPARWERENQQNSGSRWDAGVSEQRRKTAASVMAVRWKLAHGEERAAWAAAWLVNCEMMMMLADWINLLEFYWLIAGELELNWSRDWAMWIAKVLGQQLAAAALSTGQRSDGSELEFELGSAEEGRRQNECSGVGCCVWPWVVIWWIGCELIWNWGIDWVRSDAGNLNWCKEEKERKWWWREWGATVRVQPRWWLGVEKKMRVAGMKRWKERKRKGRGRNREEKKQN